MHYAGAELGRTFYGLVGAGVGGISHQAPPAGTRYQPTELQSRNYFIPAPLFFLKFGSESYIFTLINNIKKIMIMRKV